jgi:nitronate monooxygenase
MDVLSLFKYPIIQGPMAGGSCTPALVAAVGEAGALGSLAGSLLSPDTIASQAQQVRALTNSPFLINLFVQQTPEPSPVAVAEAISFLTPFVKELGLLELPVPQQWCQPFNLQFEAVLVAKPAVASFTFGILSAHQVERLHHAGIAVIGTATTVDEALAWERVGADAVVASGLESGGHRGTFLGRQEDADLFARELWPAVAQAVRIPVIAAGGIMDGEDIREALELGASAVQMGTAFLVADESGVDPFYKQRLLAADEETMTRLTRSFSGRLARGLENRFMREMAEVEHKVPAYPVQNALTTPIRAAAAVHGNTELMSLWAGTGVSRSRAMPAGELVRTLARELDAASRLARFSPH